MKGPDERRSGLGRPLDELLERAGSPSLLMGMLEDEPVVVEVLVELLRQRFPGDLVGVHVDQAPPVTRVAGRRPTSEAGLEISAAAREAMERQRPRLSRSGGAHVYAVPRRRDGALAVWRCGAELTVNERRYVDLLANHVH